MSKPIRRKKGIENPARRAPSAKLDTYVAVCAGWKLLPGTEPFFLSHLPQPHLPPLALDQEADAERPELALRFAVRSHVGLVRDENEDNLVVMPADGLYVVADGMGGHAAGQIASEICVKTIADFYQGSQRLRRIPFSTTAGVGEATMLLEQSMLMANRAIYQASLEVGSRQGMGTTVVGLQFTGDTVSICHAGDSRAYLLRGGRIAQITPDHSLSNFLFGLGRDAEARLAAATMSNVIMRALGLEGDVDVEAQELAVQPGDRFLLCSDGLSDLVSDTQLEFFLGDAHLSLEDISDRLVERALQAGGRDNITVLIVEVALASHADTIATETVRQAEDDRIEWEEATSPGSRRPLMDTDPNDLTPVPSDD